jgi:hypothetical protein
VGPVCVGSRYHFPIVQYLCIYNGQGRLGTYQPLPPSGVNISRCHSGVGGGECGKMKEENRELCRRIKEGR